MRSARRRLAPLLAAAAVLVHPAVIEAQVTGEVEVRDGAGRGLVRNTSRVVLDVEMALWESDESGPQVELLRPADAAVWPAEVRLEPGETQTIRFLVTGDPYPANTLLRLETRFIPVESAAVPATDGTSVPAGVQAKVRMVTRILSKVWIR